MDLVPIGYHPGLFCIHLSPGSARIKRRSQPARGADTAQFLVRLLTTPIRCGIAVSRLVLRVTDNHHHRLFILSSFDCCVLLVYDMRFDKSLFHEHHPNSSVGRSETRKGASKWHCTAPCAEISNSRDNQLTLLLDDGILRVSGDCRCALLVLNRVG
jgi:hypothetical protein